MADKPVRLTAAGRWRAAVDPYAYMDATPVPGKLWTSTQVTASTGRATFTIPSGYFTVLHSVQATPTRNSSTPGDFCFAFVVTKTVTSVVIQVAESKQSGVLVGGFVEGLEASGAGISVDLAVMGI